MPLNTELPRVAAKRGNPCILDEVVQSVPRKRACSGGVQPSGKRSGTDRATLGTNEPGAVHLAKLTRLEGLEIGTRNATPSCLQQVARLPLEYLQLGDGLDTPEGIGLIKDISTLRRLTLTNAKALTDADLKLVASITQLEHLELGGINLPDERLALLKDFAFLKSMRLVPSSTPFTPETQAKIKQLLTKTELQFK